jgi:FkbM family methyltransferase
MQRIKFIVQHFLSSIGISVYTGLTSISKPYPRQSQHGILKVINRFGDLNLKTIIDIGAGCGTNSLLDIFPRLDFVLIEPLQDFEESLNKIVKSRSARTHYSSDILASSKQVVKFFIHDDKFGSSIKREFENTKNSKAIERQSTTLDDLISQINFPGPYLIKLDTQGSELEILKGSLSTLQFTKAIIVEVSVQDFFVESHSLVELINFLDDNGFRIFDLSDLTYRPSDGFLAQLDILFVKKSSNLFKIKNYG